MAEFSTADADLCVKCGLCLPHCPTYTIGQQEAESPRGRIALMTGLTAGTVAPSPLARAHLDHCLSCRACEAVCPAQVPYGALLDGFRAKGPGRTLLHKSVARLSVWTWTSSLGLSLMNSALRVVGWLRPALWRCSAAWPPLRRRLSLIPQLGPRARRQDRPHADIAFFAGCVGDAAGAQARQALERICARLDLSISVPAQQGCCGALAQHRGLNARTHAARNRSAFATRRQPIVALDTGCLAQLLADPEIAPRLQEASSFIASRLPAGIALRPLASEVLIHLPCTARNVVRPAHPVAELLARIPGLQLSELAGNALCCGAAGRHMLDFPALADALVAPKLSDIVAREPDYVVTTNIGCQLHLQAALRRAGLNVPVVHPLELIAQQWPDHE